MATSPSREISRESSRVSSRLNVENEVASIVSALQDLIVKLLPTSIIPLSGENIGPQVKRLDQIYQQTQRCVNQTKEEEREERDEEEEEESHRAPSDKVKAAQSTLRQLEKAEAQLKSLAQSLDAAPDDEEDQKKEYEALRKTVEACNTLQSLEEKCLDAQDRWDKVNQGRASRQKTAAPLSPQMELAAVVEFLQEALRSAQRWQTLIHPELDGVVGVTTGARLKREIQRTLSRVKVALNGVPSRWRQLSASTRSTVLLFITLATVASSALGLKARSPEAYSRLVDQVLRRENEKGLVRVLRQALRSLSTLLQSARAVRPIVH